VGTGKEVFLWQVSSPQATITRFPDTWQVTSEGGSPSGRTNKSNGTKGKVCNQGTIWAQLVAISGTARDDAGGQGPR
jgi:hypothetical protein